MGDTPLMLLFQSVIADAGQPLSPGLEQQELDDSSFLECLLGVLGHGDALGKNEASLELRKRLLMASLSEATEPDSGGDLLGLLPGRTSLGETAEVVLQQDGIKAVEESLPQEAGHRKAMEMVGKIASEASEENPVPQEILEARGTKAVSHGSPELAKETSGGFAGTTRKEQAAASDTVRIPGDPSLKAEPVLLRRQGRVLTGTLTESSSPESEEVTGQVSGRTSQDQIRGSYVRQLNHLTAKGGRDFILRQPSVDGIEEKGGLPLPMAKATKQFPLSDPSVTEIGESKRVIPQMAEEGRNLFLPDPSIAKTTQKVEFQEFMIPQKETISSLETQPPVLVETGNTLQRPVPLSLADGVMQQILENLNVKAWRIGKKELRIQLHPEEMGRLRMEIGMKDHQVVLKINVENPHVKDLIENNLSQLREGLLDRGLKMDRCLVTVNDHFQHHAGGSHDDSTASVDHSLPIAGDEVEETALENPSSSDHWDGGHVNLFI